MSTRGLTVTVIGETMVEFSPQPGGLFSLGFAGDSFNTAVYLKRALNHPHSKVSYVSAVGQDALSARMVEEISHAGLMTDMIATDPDHTVGSYLISNDPDGERHFHYWRNQSAASCMMSTLDLDRLTHQLSQSDLIYLSGISLAILPTPDREELISMLVRSGQPVAFDPNHRPALWRSAEEAISVYANMADVASYLLPTFSDDQLLWDPDNALDAFAHWESIGARETVLKLGSEGALVTGCLVSAEPVSQVVDTTGAGDAFNAAYLAARLNGKEPAIAAHQGNQLAARVIRHRGAILPPDQ